MQSEKQVRSVWKVVQKCVKGCRGRPKRDLYIENFSLGGAKKHEDAERMRVLILFEVHAVCTVENQVPVVRSSTQKCKA